jgi:hypothetical protein
VNNEKASRALAIISEGFAELSEAVKSPGVTLVGIDPETGDRPFADPPDWLPPLEEDPIAAVVAATGGTEVVDEGSLAICPRHRIAYKPSKFAGKPGYCSAKADDAWSKRGFCTINPNNAAIWLRQAAVTA